MPSADVYWLALRRTRGVGPRTCKLLIEKFGSPEKIFQLSSDQIAAAGVPRNTARSITEFRDFEPLEKELCELPNIGARLVKWTDTDYPPNLRQIADPPPFLFVRGTAPLIDTNCIAIVGARAASDIGRRMAQRLGLELAAKGFTVVSGLARGIDGEAHQGALDAHGKTVAVLGCGVDVIYPAEHRKLAEAILEGGGALISELPIGSQPLAENFPTRNRILSGLCLGVVIVEAAEKSGSLITARMALEAGSSGVRRSRKPAQRQDSRQQPPAEGRREAGRMRRGRDRGACASDGGTSSGGRESICGTRRTDSHLGNV